jgi:hypothetical protein
VLKFIVCAVLTSLSLLLYSVISSIFEPLKGKKSARDSHSWRMRFQELDRRRIGDYVLATEHTQAYLLDRWSDHRPVSSSHKKLRCSHHTIPRLGWSPCSIMSQHSVSAAYAADVMAWSASPSPTSMASM